MIQVWTTDQKAGDVTNLVNDWLRDPDHQRYAILNIQYVMGSEVGHTNAMIVYDTENTLTKLRNISDRLPNPRDLQV